VNFFDHQDAAERNTRRLVILFVLSIVAVILLLYLPIAFALANQNEDSGSSGQAPPWWDVQVFLCIASAATAVIMLGAGVKRMQLRGGGKAVAESLGGTWLNPAGASPSERRLLDVVEEMSIASGMPVPPVYVIDDESINAFAAGNTPNDAVLGFTRAAIEQLSRDEMQGVVGHEFSHIAHGDTRLNVRLACAVAGVMVIVLIGRALLYAAGRVPRSSSKKGDGGAGLMMIALLLLLVGGLGAFFGRILQAAISRQREFLADASAAQYTRDPGALANALRRIAGIGDNHMNQAAASGMNHFFFTSALNTWLATHPPIQERIRRLEGSAQVIAQPTHNVDSTMPATAMGFASASAGFRGGGEAVARYLNLVPDHLAGIVDRCVPTIVSQSCREPFDAQAVLLLFTWSEDEAVQESQREIVQRCLGPAMAAMVSRLHIPMQSLQESSRLVVLDLCMPALAQLSQPQYQRFRDALSNTIRADGKVSLFEWTMRTVLSRRVEGRFGALADRPGSASLSSRTHDVLLLLSALAWAGGRQRAAQALANGLNQLHMLATKPLPAEQCTLDAVDAALEQLCQLTEPARHRLMQAVAATITEDEKINSGEQMLTRAIADRLNVMIPPLLAHIDTGALLNP